MISLNSTISRGHAACCFSLEADDAIVVPGKGAVSEERFGRIEFRLDGLQRDVAGLRQDVNELRHDVTGLRQDVGVLRQDVNVLRQDVGELNVGYSELRTEVRDVRRHMLVLHEEVISTIKALDPAPQIEQLRRETREQITALRDEIDHRLTPLELTVRDLVRQQRPPA